MAPPDLEAELALERAFNKHPPQSIQKRQLNHPFELMIQHADEQVTA
jgi:hypothetical protein